MNHKNAGTVLVTAAVLFLAVYSAGAATFEPKFTIAKVAGACEVQAPGTNDFVAAAEGQAWEYGSVIKAGAASSCILSFSLDNGLLVCQNTVVKIDESRKSRKYKILRLAEGEIEFNLEKDFRKHNRLSVETPSAVLDAIACTCAVDHRIIGDLKTSTYRCTEGEVELAGDFFSMTGLGGGEQVTIAETPNNNFLRIKVVVGEITIIARDTNGSERKITMSTGDELTIMANDSTTDTSKLDVVYKIVFADQQKPELSPWQATFPKPEVEPPAKPEVPAGPVPPLPQERKWSSLTVAPPVPTVTPVGKQ